MRAGTGTHVHTEAEGGKSTLHGIMDEYKIDETDIEYNASRHCSKDERDIEECDVE